MTAPSPDEFLDSQLPDEIVIRDLREVLSASDGRIELDGGVMETSRDCDLQILSKALVCRRYDVAFGSCFSVTVAIGGIRSLAHGVIEPVHCFAISWYRLDLQLITIDVSDRLP